MFYHAMAIIGLAIRLILIGTFNAIAIFVLIWFLPSIVKILFWEFWR
jgi:hypothetical protein